MKIREEYTCPLEMAHDITRGKWKPILLWQLGKEERTSFSRLKRDIKGISEKMLTQQLGELLEYGMASRRRYEGYPLRVEYSLTERGRKVLEAVSILQEVGIQLMLEDGRADFLRQLGFVE